MGVSSANPLNCPTLYPTHVFPSTSQGPSPLQRLRQLLLLRLSHGARPLSPASSKAPSQLVLRARLETRFYPFHPRKRFSLDPLFFKKSVYFNWRIIVSQHVTVFGVRQHPFLVTL